MEQFYAKITGDIKEWSNTKHLNMVGGVYTDDGYNLMTNWTPGHLEFGIYTADTTIKYEYYYQSQTIVTHDTVFIFPIWLILLTILAVVIYILRKKEVSSPLKIKIEWNK